MLTVMMVRLLLKNCIDLAPLEGTETLLYLAPGAIETDRNADVLKEATYRQKVLSSIPAHAIGEGYDCAGAALLLCSDAGRYITGENLFVDGGMHL